MARLLDLYRNDIAKAVATKFNHQNPMAIPKLTKIIINMGVGKATQDKAQVALGTQIRPLGEDRPS